MKKSSCLIGFYCDQRDNRKLIRELSNNRTVLDAFCYTGGFGINAILGGASSVVCLDSSQSALQTALINAQLNGLTGSLTTYPPCLSTSQGVDQTPQTMERLTFIKCDALEYMKLCQQKQHLYDIVICDPPKLAPTRKSLEKAKTK